MSTSRNNHFDIANNEIKPGDFVIYSALWDRSATLKYGIVTRLAKRGSSRYLLESEKYTVRVLSVDRNWSGKTKITTWELQKKGKEVTLGFLDRMLVVPSTLVPIQAKEVLQKALEERK